jgi:hypothetical protein
MFCDGIATCYKVMADLVWLFVFDLRKGLVQNLPSICLLLAKFFMQKMTLNSEVLLKSGNHMVTWELRTPYSRGRAQSVLRVIR